MIKEWKSYSSHTKQQKNFRSKHKREANRTWTNGKLITFISFSIFKKEYRFICQMKKVPEFFGVHRCVACKIINKFRPCMDIGGEMHTKCMRKSDLSCYPRLIKRIPPAK